MKDYEQEASFLKGSAMILVIMTHFITPEIREKMYDLFHIIQAVPVLVFLSSFFLCRKIKNDHLMSKNLFLILFCRHSLFLYFIFLPKIRI